ncbi:MAG: NAD(P)/FAD-dependent oxidoreductase [Candidatus Aenigmatarchaeota archaeon]
MFDVVIVGCGPAGLSAAIFCARARLKTLVIGKRENSQLILAKHIENYFGFPEPIDGKDLLSLGMKQATKFGAEILNDEVVIIKQKGKLFSLKTEKKIVESKAIIIATGVPIVLSGIKNEVEFRGRGLGYCVNCDGSLFRGKKIVVVGNGNHAAEDAIQATSYSNNITLVSNSEQLAYSKKYENELKKHKIKVMVGEVDEFVGKKFLTGLKFSDGKVLDCDAVFMACGTTSALDFANELALDVKNNMIVVDDKNMTSFPGVFAAGNCMGQCRQIARNVGDGCNAAINIIKYLKMKDIYLDFGEK